MATPPNPCGVLETMEKGEHKIQNVESATLIGVEDTGDGELPKRGVEGGAIAELCAHENNNSGQTWISIHVSPLSESTCKLLNRLGTERYARWCGRGTNHPPIRLKNHMTSFYQGWRRETRDRVVKKEPKKSCQILTTLSLARLLYAVI